jgi:hypothetical protein
MTWIDPNGRAFAFLPPAREMSNMHKMEDAMRNSEEKRAAKTQALTTQPKLEILPPGSKVPALALPSDTSTTPGLDLVEFERQIRNSANMLNLAEPEGFLDRWFGRPDHRIDVKTERAQRLKGYITACTAIIEAAGSLQDARGQVYLNQLILRRRVAEENYKLELTQRQVERQDAIEEARAREIVSEHEAKIRENNLRGRPTPPAPPPPLPPPPPPTPAELRAKKKASLKQDLDRLDKEEKDDLSKISGGKPQGEWTDAMHEDIKRTVNMYHHAKQKVRDELREYI